MHRPDHLARLSDSSEIWDILIIGGGATGLAIAVDAASRGYRTALLEQADFSESTSSKSTKLIHGGVRYLRSGEIGLGALRRSGYAHAGQRPAELTARHTCRRDFPD